MPTSIHSLGGLTQPEIDLRLLEKAGEIRLGLETMLEKKLDETRQALAGRLDLQDEQIALVKAITVEGNASIKELCNKHEQWHESDITFRTTVATSIEDLQKQVKTIRVFIIVCTSAGRFARYLFENSDKATGLTLKFILAGILYLCGQNFVIHIFKHFFAGH